MVGTGARIAVVVLAVLALGAPGATAKPKQANGPVKVQLLGLNDFHGNLQPVPESSSSGRIGTTPAGGAEYLATHVRRLTRANRRNTLVVAAGDLIGASPLLSALFHDEPTIEAFNKIGLDLNAVGNHEFDEGETELVRMQRGGCHPTDGCRDGNGFKGAKFKFLAANVVDRETGKPLFRPYAIRRFGASRRSPGIRVGFIGMTLEGTPDIVTPSGIARLRFLDEAETANRYARQLRRRHGVKAVVVLLHEGGQQTPATALPNECTGFSGPIADIVDRTTQKVDLFVTGHTHQAYNCDIDGRPVTSASSFGRLITDIDLRLSRRTRDVTQVRANNRIITRDVMKAPDITRLIERYSTLAAPFANRVIGRSTAAITREADDSGESAAGNLIADAQLAATDTPEVGGAVAAFMNSGGVRADFPAGDITYGAAFTVQPFGNNLTTISLTGAQLYRMLAQQWCGQAGGAKILQPSDTVRYTYSAAAATAATGQPCPPAANPVRTFTIAGQPVSDDASRSYRVTVNSFLADGGDGYSVLPEGSGRLGGPVDTDALEQHIAPSLTGPPIAPPPRDRITLVP